MSMTILVGLLESKSEFKIVCKMPISKPFQCSPAQRDQRNQIDCTNAEQDNKHDRKIEFASVKRRDKLGRCATSEQKAHESAWLALFFDNLRVDAGQKCD